MDRAATPSPPGVRRRTRLRFWLAVLWFVSSFGALFFARDLSAITLFGWPLSYWLAAQGCVLVFFGIAASYAAVENRLEAKARRATDTGDA